jgi:hypothetical protein
MKTIVSFLSGVVLLAIAGVSSAAIITDTIYQSEFVDWGESHSYTHDINDDDFVLGTAVSGNLQVDVSDDGGFLDLWETILFTVEAFDFDTGTISFGSGFDGELEVIALGELNADGLLDVTVSSLFGDFYVGDSVLTVVTSDVSVPTPSALLLLSLGLLGLGAVRKVKA